MTKVPSGFGSTLARKRGLQHTPFLVEIHIRNVLVTMRRENHLHGAQDVRFGATRDNQ